VIPAPTLGTASPAKSPECAVAARPGYQDVHGQCRQTGDVPLPHAIGLTLVHRCTCRCHGYGSQDPAALAGADFHPNVTTTP
jgi:hypothetical protein